ncbi:MAG TPA: hypothetical protein VL049_28330 [Candidatus Dormibacteraeota bacterium]|nr:hypothetical protein [Candidatus Dormibacteraeota bacterium]
MTGNFPHSDGTIEHPEEANPEIREALSARLDFTPAYRALFEDAYPDPGRAWRCRRTTRWSAPTTTSATRRSPTPWAASRNR